MCFDIKGWGDENKMDCKAYSRSWPVLRRWFCCCWLLLIVTPSVGVCNCSMFCCTLLYIHSSFAIILMGKWELLLCLVYLPGVSWLLCGSSSWCHGFVCGLWLWYFLIIPTYYFGGCDCCHSDSDSVCGLLWCSSSCSFSHTTRNIDLDLPLI